MPLWSRHWFDVPSPKFLWYFLTEMRSSHDLQGENVCFSQERYVIITWTLPRDTKQFAEIGDCACEYQYNGQSVLNFGHHHDHVYCPHARDGAFSTNSQFFLLHSWQYNNYLFICQLFPPRLSRLKGSSIVLSIWIFPLVCYVQRLVSSRLVYVSSFIHHRETPTNLVTAIFVINTCQWVK